jgi:hypothetical protein
MIFLSLGAGVQSTCLLMLGIRGEIERPDHIIFADTGFEPLAVYEHLEWCKRQAEKAGIPLHVVKAKMDMREGFDGFEAGTNKFWNERPPFYVENKKDMQYSDGEKEYSIKAGRGTMLRQCTRDAKIKPIERKQKELMGFKTSRGIPDGAAIVQIGISTDEARRASPSTVRWIERDYPLIDPLKWSRADCQAWWEHEYPHVSLPSSSCIICPYKTSRMWARMKQDQPEDFADACDLDDRFRAAFLRRTKQTVYIHRDFVPLREANLNETQGSFDLEDAIYCAGGCGL